MNDSVRNDLKNSCSVKEYEVLVKLIQIIETTPDKKQKEAIKAVIDEEIE